MNAAVAVEKEFRDARYLIASQLLALQPSLVLFVTPAYFGALARQRGFSMEQLAAVTSAESAGTIAVATLLAVFAARVNLRALALVGTALLTGALICCLIVKTLTALLVVRIGVGLGDTMLTTGTIIYISSTGRPVRWFGWQMTLTTLITMLGLGVMPLVEARYGLPGFYAALLVIAPVTLWSALVLPPFPQRHMAQRATADGAPGTWRNSRAIIGILAVMFYAGYVYPTYNLSERFGALLGLTPVTLGLVLSATTPVGIVGSLLASTLPERLGGARPPALCAGLALAAAIALFVLPGLVTFCLMTGVLSFIWNFAQPYLYAAVARVDADGRFMFLQSPAQEIPKALVTFVFSLSLGAGSYAPTVFLGASLMLASALCAALATRRSTALKPLSA